MKRTLVFMIILSLLALSGCSGVTIAGDNATINNTTENNEDQIITKVEPVTTITTDKSTNNNTDNSTSDSTTIDDTEYRQLQEENQQLKNEKSELENEIKRLEAQISDMPIIESKDMGLSIDGKDIPINQNASIMIIDGRKYYSEEIIESIMPDDKKITIDDNNSTLFIGKIITEKSSLFDEVTVYSENIARANTIKDSYGNLCTNVLYPQNYHSHIIFNLNSQFSFLKLKLAVKENGNSDAIVTIKADDAVVYTSPSLGITTKPFDVIDIPLNGCSLLTIEIDSGMNGGMGKGFDCIISDPIVYN